MTNRTEIRVRYAETDAMGFVYHSNYFIWFEIGRTETMRALGRSYAQAESDGVLLPAIEAGCRFIKPAHYDDVIQIESSGRWERGARFRFDYRIRRLPEGELLAEGFTVHVPIGRDGAILRQAVDDLRRLFSDPA